MTAIWRVGDECVPGAHGVLGDGDGRAVLFAAIQQRFPPRLAYHVLPFLLAVAFVLIALLPEDEPALGILAFGLAGLGCSALLPLTISFGQGELAAVSAAAAGGVIAFYQLGYGIAAFGVGPLLDAGVELSTVYAVAAFVAAAMGVWSFVVARGRPSPPTRPTRCRGRPVSRSLRGAVRARARRPARGRHRGRRRAPHVLGGRTRAARRLRGRRAWSRSGRGQVLLPWPNRIEDGSYEFDGRRHQLALNEPRRATRSTASSAGSPGASASASRAGSS